MTTLAEPTNRTEPQKSDDLTELMVATVRQFPAYFHEALRNGCRIHVDARAHFREAEMMAHARGAGEEVAAVELHEDDQRFDIENH